MSNKISCRKKKKLSFQRQSRDLIQQVRINSNQIPLNRGFNYQNEFKINIISHSPKKTILKKKKTFNNVFNLNVNNKKPLKYMSLDSSLNEQNKIIKQQQWFCGICNEVDQENQVYVSPCQVLTKKYFQSQNHCYFCLPKDL